MRSPSTQTQVCSRTQILSLQTTSPHTPVTSQEVWIPAQKYSPDQDLKLGYSQAHLQSKPSVVVGFGFFVQPARKEGPRPSH